MGRAVCRWDTENELKNKNRNFKIRALGMAEMRVEYSATAQANIW